MPPKTSLAKPDTHVELKKEWALTLPLEYDEDTVLDRNEVEIFVRQLRCKINRADTPDIKEDLNQIFSMFAKNWYPGQENWLQKGHQLNIGILYSLQLLRDDLMDKDDRWQVEIWIKIIAGILNEPDEVYYDERDKLTVPAEMQPYEFESSDLNGKKRNNSSIVHVRSSNTVDDQAQKKGTQREEEDHIA